MNCMKNIKSVRVLLASAFLILTLMSLWGCAPVLENGVVTTVADTSSDDGYIGQGSIEFKFTVTDIDGNETVFNIRTDKDTVGEALEDVDLISGEEGAFGLYVKSVNGIIADYDTDGTYWAFYANGEYSLTGVDQTKVENGASYAFKVEKS